MDTCIESNPYRDNLCDTPIDEASVKTGPNYQEIVEAGYPGKIEFYDGSRFTGRELEFNFKYLYSDYAEFKANEYINFDDDRFAFNDKTSSLRYKLNDGWRIRIFEHSNGRGRSETLSSGTGQWIVIEGNPFKEFWNNRISSFILERSAD